MAEILDVTDGSFEDRDLKSESPVLVDFWAEWCGPCRALAPVVQELAEEHAGTLTVCKVDVDSSPAVPARYNVKSIPTLLFFKGGNVVDQIVGAVPKHKISEKLEALLA